MVYAEVSRRFSVALPAGNEVLESVKSRAGFLERTDILGDCPPLCAQDGSRSGGIDFSRDLDFAHLRTSDISKTPAIDELKICPWIVYRR